MGTRDPNPKHHVTVESVPSGLGQVTTSSTTVTAGDTKVFNITVVPFNEILDLWQFLWNAFIDTDDPTFDYFGGTALTLVQRSKLIVSANENWAQSSDLSNQRVFKIKIVNQDSSDHTVYMKFKAYTFAGVG